MLGLVSVEEVSLLDVPLELWEELLLLSRGDWLSACDGDTGNTTEGSFVVVSLELGCTVARGALGGGTSNGCASLWS